VKKISFALFALITVCSLQCKQQGERMNGDLYFSFFRVGSFYNQPKYIIDSFERYADTANIQTAGTDDKKLLAAYAILKREGLLYSPFVNIKLAGDTIITLYMSAADYADIKKIHYKQLMAEHKKIYLQFSAKPLGDNMFACTALYSVSQLPGDTYLQSKKLLIEDYQ